jgi:glycerol-3-phosphate acyltransferase PlsX
VQFAFMGAAFAHTVLGIARPRVGFLSNGEEAERGSEAVVAAHTQLSAILAGDLSAATMLEFVGNVEGTDVPAGSADVVVTDGFTGNVCLKLIEGVSSTVLGAIREAATRSARGQLGGLLLRSSLRAFRESIDPEHQGGAYLLGLRRLAVVPHGRFRSRGFASAILRADRGVKADVVASTHSALELAGALRASPVRQPR